MKFNLPIKYNYILANNKIILLLQYNTMIM